MPASFQNVRSTWLPEIHHHCPGTPYLIVGTRVDTRNEASVREKPSERDLAVTEKEDGEKMATELGAVGYVECSALTRFNLEDVFNKVRHNGRGANCLCKMHQTFIDNVT